MSEGCDGNKGLKVLITGSSLSDNKGAMAMTLVLGEQIRAMAPQCRLWLASKYPHRDAEIARREGIELVNCPPRRIVTTIFLRSLLAMAPGFSGARWLYDSVMRAYSEADIVVDLGGVAFSDDRDWRGLLLSIGWILPAVATGTPFVKLSQALGPFRKMCNRVSARMLLKKCGLLIARGEDSAINVRQLLGADYRCYVYPDVAFLLRPAADEAVDKFLEGQHLGQRGFVAVSPSVVVDRKADSKEGKGSYRKAMKELAEHIVGTTGARVVLLPHAWPPGGRGYGDMDLCCDIYDGLEQRDNIFVIREELDAGMLKGIISRSEVFVSCRFHAMIAALSSKVPTMVIGWGHKYNEIMRLFDSQDYCCDFSEADAAGASGLFSRLWQDREELRGRIGEKLKGVEESARENFNLLGQFLREKDLL